MGLILIVILIVLILIVGRWDVFFGLLYQYMMNLKYLFSSKNVGLISEWRVTSSNKKEQLTHPRLNEFAK